jgi:hypothetical protein
MKTIKDTNQKKEIAIALHLGFIEEVGAVKEKFVPKVGDEYWYISAYGMVDFKINNGDNVDVGLTSIGNCYRTEAEALESRERVLKAY